MSELSYLSNGRFDNELDSWQIEAGSPAIVRAGGYQSHNHLSLPAGANLSQSFSVAGSRQYILHIAVKSADLDNFVGFVVSILDDSPAAVESLSPAAGMANQWEPQRFPVWLNSGVTYTIELDNSGGAGEVFVDTLWLWLVPLSRRQMAEMVHSKLGSLASDLSYSTSPTGDTPEGHYSNAIDEALRAIGAINPVTGFPDERWIAPAQIQSLLNLIERAMLERLQYEYATQVDVKAGPISESLSQKGAAITAMLSGDGQTGPVVSRRLTREDWYR